MYKVLIILSFSIFFSFLVGAVAFLILPLWMAYIIFLLSFSIFFIHWNFGERIICKELEVRDDKKLLELQRVINSKAYSMGYKAPRLVVSEKLKSNIVCLKGFSGQYVVVSKDVIDKLYDYELNEVLNWTCSKFSGISLRCNTFVVSTGWFLLGLSGAKIFQRMRVTHIFHRVFFDFYVDAALMIFRPLNNKEVSNMVSGLDSSLEKMRLERSLIFGDSRDKLMKLISFADNCDEDILERVFC